MNHLEVIRVFLNPENFTTLPSHFIHKNYHMALKIMARSEEWLQDPPLVRNVIQRLEVIHLLDKALIGQVSAIYRKIYNSIKKEKLRCNLGKISLRYSGRQCWVPKKILMAESYFFLHFFSDSGIKIYDFSDEKEHTVELFIDYILNKTNIEEKNALEMLSFSVKYAVPDLFLMSLKYLLNPNYPLDLLEDRRLKELVNDLKDKCSVSFHQNLPYLEMNAEEETVWSSLEAIHRIIPMNKVKLVGCEDFVALWNFLVTHPSLSDVRLVKSPLIDDSQIQELLKLNARNHPLFIKKEKSVVERFLHRLNIPLPGTDFKRCLNLARQILSEDIPSSQDFKRMEDDVILRYLSKIDYSPRVLESDSLIIFLKKKKLFYPKSVSLEFERRHIRVYKLSSELLGKGHSAKVYKLLDVTVKQQSSSSSVDARPKYKALKVFQKKIDNIRESEINYRKIVAGGKKEGIVSSWSVLEGSFSPYFSVLTPCYEASLKILFPAMAENPAFMAYALLKVLKGISAIHRQGFCHLDIKEDNILIKNKLIVPGIYRTDIAIADLDTLSNEETHVEIFTRHTPMYFPLYLAVERFNLISQIKTNPKKSACYRKKLVKSCQSADLSAVGLTFLMALTKTPTINYDSSTALYQMKKIEIFNTFTVTDELTALGEEIIGRLKKEFFLLNLLLKMIGPRESHENLDDFIKEIEEYQKNF